MVSPGILRHGNRWPHKALCCTSLSNQPHPPGAKPFPNKMQGCGSCQSPWQHTSRVSQSLHRGTIPALLTTSAPHPAVGTQGHPSIPQFHHPITSFHLLLQPLPCNKCSSLHPEKHFQEAIKINSAQSLHFNIKSLDRMQQSCRTGGELFVSVHQVHS